jgi:hypothetical protein
MWIWLGIVIGFGWNWLLNWTRARNVRISWLVWALLILAVLDVVTGLQNYFGLIQEYEETAAATMIPIYGLQVVILGGLAVLLLWRQVQRARA